jgi:predicted metalloprotease with PDZ domain
MRLLFGLLAATLTLPATAADTPLQYTLTFPEAANHYAHIELKVTDVSESELEFMMPVWTPGSYLVREFARHIDQISAKDGTGKDLEIKKSRKNRWKVSTNGADTVVVSYRLYCREMSVRTNWVEENFAMLNGAPTFLTLVGGRERQHIVKPKRNGNWKQIVSPLSKLDATDAYVAENFDELVDSPLLLGSPQSAEFQVGGKPHWLVNQNGETYWDVDKAAKDVEKVVAEHQRMWGTVPYPRYVFFNMITESGGGLEHDNSTVLMTSRWRFRVEKDYKRWLTLVSHEFFHTWNVRRLRPRGLRKYDYERENYTDSLWIAEGLTSYYENLAMIRAGLFTREEYLASLSSDIDGVEKYPGKNVQSLSDSSRDTWIKFYRPDENSRNTTVSYYGKGAVAGFLLDAEIRRATKNEKSLDDVMRLMFKRHEKEGYLPEDFRATVAEVAGKELTDWFRTHIDTASPMEYDRALEWFGLEFAGKEKAEEKPADKESSDEKPKEEQKKSEPKPWTGFSAGGSRFAISSVQSGSPAAKAGLNVGDEVLAINGFRVDSSSLSSRMKQYKVGDTISILTSRRQEVIERSLTLAEERKPLKLKWIKKPTDEQKANAAAWLLDEGGEDEKEK